MRTTGISIAVLAAMTAGCLSEWERGSSGDGSFQSDVTSTPTVETGASGPSGPTVLPIVAPTFGPTVVQDVPPPPLSGGTIAVAPDGTVVAADPDRDRVYIIDVALPHVLTVALDTYDEPGRVAIDASGRAHVALRGAGDLVTIDLATASIVARRHACSAPRGVAYDPSQDVVHVACVGGELVTFPAAAGAPASVRYVADDLRDVVVTSNGIRVSTFRRGAILGVNPDGSTHEIRQAQREKEGTQVAWRMIAVPPNPTGPDDDTVVAGQQAPDTLVETPARYYVDACGNVGPVPILRDGDTVSLLPTAVLPVDVAVSKGLVAVVAAGNGHTPELAQLIFTYRRMQLCTTGTGVQLPGQITSVAFEDENTAVALSREPAALFVVDARTNGLVKTIPLGGSSREDTGHAVFHANAGSGIACASCHVEGRDDGHAWLSQDVGRRRTPSLAGTLRGTAPYHWTGEAKNMAAIAQLTFESRMQGPLLGADQVGALRGWLEGLSPVVLAAPADDAALQRGGALFAAQCASCHAGTMLTNNATVDVGTGGAFQVPSLVGVASRAPYLHDGRAATLEQAIPLHANRSLSAAEARDVVTYLRSR